MKRRTMVFGPAYLDRVLHVDRPLVDHDSGPPLDQSVDGSWKFGAGLTLIDPVGAELIVELPPDWPGPTGTVCLSRSFRAGPPSSPRKVNGLSWHDDLGGMGAGYASAFQGELISALGGETDPMSQAIVHKLEEIGIAHHPIRIEDQAADWTLLITSGRFGDKLPVGFRGCHARLTSLSPWKDKPCDLRVVAALPNALAADILRGSGASVRFFAPAMRNMVDDTHPISGFVEAIDVMSCNRHEWNQLRDREQVAWSVSILSITDGAQGSEVRFTSPTGEPGAIRVGAFPRDRPPRDTNRAGEAYAATLVSALMDQGWRGGVIEEAVVLHAALRASAAAALELDLIKFGFPNREEIDDALRKGQVLGEDGDDASDLR